MKAQRAKAPPWSQFLLFITVILLYFPLSLLTGSSFLVGDGELKIGLKWFIAALTDPDLSAALIRSFIVASISSLLATLIGLAAALSLGQLVRRIAKVSLLLPEIVFSLSLLSLFALLRFELGLMTVIFAHATFSVAYALFTISARLSNIDPLMLEAARDLGETEWGILRKILIPLLWPSILAAYVLCLILSFDDFLIAFFTSGFGSETLPVKIYSSLRTGMTPKLNALSALVFLGTSFLALVTFRLLFDSRRDSP